MADIINNIFMHIKDNPIRGDLTMKENSFYNKLRAFKKSNKRPLILVDPIGLQPIKTVASLPSKGYYKKFSFFNKTPIVAKNINNNNNINNKAEIKMPQRKIKEVNNSLLLKECPSGKIRNPNTGRCITKKNLKDCPKGKIRNPKSGSCMTDKTKSQLEEKKAEHIKKIENKVFNKEKNDILYAIKRINDLKNIKKQNRQLKKLSL